MKKGFLICDLLENQENLQETNHKKLKPQWKYIRIQNVGLCNDSVNDRSALAPTSVQPSQLLGIGECRKYSSGI